MKFLRKFISVVAVLTAFCLTMNGLLFAASLAGLTPPQIPEATVPLFVIVLIGIPCLAAWRVARLVNRRSQVADRSTARPFRKWVVGAIVAAYMLTAIIGIPATTTQQTTWAVNEYNRLKASGSTRVWDAHPYIRSYIAIPLAPCLILSYHEYQLDGLYGFGGFELTFWYLFGVKSLGSLPLWLS